MKGSIAVLDERLYLCRMKGSSCAGGKALAVLDK